MSLPSYVNIHRRSFSTDSFGEDTAVIRRPRAIFQEEEDPATMETMPSSTQLEVPGGTLYLRLAAVQGEDIVEIRAVELLQGYPKDTRLYWFKGRRSIDGRVKKLPMSPPTTHRIRIPGLDRKVYVKEFNWKGRYLIVG